MTAIRAYAAGQWREPQYWENPSWPDDGQWHKWRADSSGYPLEGDFTSGQGEFEFTSSGGKGVWEAPGMLVVDHTAVESAFGNADCPTVQNDAFGRLLLPSTAYTFGMHAYLRQFYGVHDAEPYHPTTYVFLYYGRAGVDEPNLSWNWQTLGGPAAGWVAMAGSFTTPASSEMIPEPYFIITTTGDAQSYFECCYDNFYIRDGAGAAIPETIPGQKVRARIGSAWIDQSEV